ncbi:MAG: hypothetical protein WAV20_05705 [Blastocatellia bacterium]
MNKASDHRSPDRLYSLLPVVHRLRDHDVGEPLRALLQIIAEQVNLVEADIDQLYENWFVETCQDWVVPYIGELIGYRIVHEAGEPGEATTTQGQLHNRILIPRREVAKTIRNRRRKGTLALLEMLAGDVADWPARAVEFYSLLAATQNLNHLHLERGRTIDLRQGDALDRLGGALDELARTVDVRNLNSRRAPGRPHSSAVGLFVWRLESYPVTHAPAFCVDRAKNHYYFSLLGNDSQLFTKATDEPDPAHIADEMNVPAPIRRRAFDERTADYYGQGKSLRIWRDTHPVPLAQIVPADLSKWAYRPVGNQVAVDPRLGRIVFSQRTLPKEGVWVSYHYGFSADIGGGEYERRVRPVGERKLYRVSQRGAARDGVSQTINQALDHWRRERPRDAVIEIEDSRSYTEKLSIDLTPGQHLEIRAKNCARPVIQLLDYRDNMPDSLRIIGPKKVKPGQRSSRVLFDGLMIAGRSVQIERKLGEVKLRHCTLVPGWSLGRRCEPESENEPSLELEHTTARLVIDHSIIGTIRLNQDEVTTDPVIIRISDSILDATSPELEAIGSPDCPVAHAILTIVRSTVIGFVETHAIELAENCIFNGRVKVARRQIGCVRFCYVPPHSRTPRRYHCQPGLAGELIDQRRTKGEIGEGDVEEAKERERHRVRPRFNSLRYGTPDYCQLSDACAEEIRRGADDESEMGVFHDLFQPQRAANLRARLDEYLPAGVDAGVIYVS